MKNSSDWDLGISWAWDKKRYLLLLPNDWVIFKPKTNSQIPNILLVICNNGDILILEFVSNMYKFLLDKNTNQ